MKMIPAKFRLLAISIAIVGVFYFAINIYPRYYIVGSSRNGTDIAEILVRKKLPPSDCFRMEHFDIGMRPSIEEDQALCIYDYAKLTKDPSACELLMPSSYELACVGGRRISILALC